MNNDYIGYSAPTENKPQPPENDERDNRGERVKDIAVKTLAIVGLVALLSFAVWGTVQVVRVTPGALTAAIVNITSVFVPAEEEEITFDLDSFEIASGKPFRFAWNHDSPNEGTYFFSYSCTTGVSFESDMTVGSNAIPCGSATALATGANAIELTPLSENNRFVDVTLTLSFVPEDDSTETARGSVLMTLVNEDIENSKDALNEDGTAGNETPDNVTGGSGSAGGGVSRGEETNIIDIVPGSGTGGGVAFPSDPNGIPDLAVTVLGVGFTDRSNSQFTPATSVKDTQRAAVRFEVRNLGTKASGPWTFNAELPIRFRSNYTYRPSGSQQSLNPGERIEFTLGFDDPRTGTRDITIEVDPTNRVDETNRTNNTAVAKITIVD